jgi:hypothetical protein
MSDSTHFRNTSSTADCKMEGLAERLKNFHRYGIERIELDESLPTDEFQINKERTLIRVHPSLEAQVKKVLEDDWKKRKR